jgi:hypothetical protein
MNIPLLILKAASGAVLNRPPHVAPGLTGHLHTLVVRLSLDAERAAVRHTPGDVSIKTQDNNGQS